VLLLIKLVMCDSCALRGLGGLYMACRDYRTQSVTAVRLALWQGYPTHPRTKRKPVMTIFSYSIFPGERSHTFLYPPLPLHLIAWPRYISPSHRTVYFHLFLYRQSPLRNLSKEMKRVSTSRKIVLLFPRGYVRNQSNGSATHILIWWPKVYTSNIE
jgi:hypothetical protein